MRGINHVLVLEVMDVGMFDVSWSLNSTLEL